MHRHEDQDRFRRYLVASLITAFGDGIIFICLPVIAVVHGTATAAQREVALVVFLASAARLAAPAAGWVTRLRGPSAVVCVVTIARAAALSAAASLLVWTDTPALPIAATVAVANGLSGAATTTACNSSIPRLVPAGGLERANTLSTAAWMGGPILGYTAGGVLAAWTGAPAALALGALLTLALLLAVPVLPAREGPAADARSSRAPRRVSDASAMTGLILVLAFGLSFLINVLNVRAPAYFLADGAGEVRYGLFEGLFGLFLVLGLGLSYTHGTSISKRVVLVLVGVLAWLSCVATWALHVDAGWYLIAASIGVAVGIGQVAAMTIVQRLSPPSKLPAVTGWMVMASSGGLLFGSVASATPVLTQTLILCVGVVVGVLAAAAAAALSREQLSPPGRALRG